VISSDSCYFVYFAESNLQRDNIHVEVCAVDGFSDIHCFSSWSEWLLKVVWQCRWHKIW